MRRPDAHQKLAAREVRQQRILESQLRGPRDAQTFRLLAHRDEQQPDMRIAPDVAQALEHAVAVIVGIDQEIGGYDPREPGRSALERAIGPPFGVRGGQEEEGQALDKRLVAVRERRAMGLFQQAVGQRDAAKAALKLAVSFVVHRIHPSRTPPAR